MNLISLPTWRFSSYEFKNIFKYRILGQSMMLVVDTKSNMTPKYGRNFFIIRRRYKRETEIDTTRHDACTIWPLIPYLKIHNNSGEHPLPRQYVFGFSCLFFNSYSKNIIKNNNTKNRTAPCGLHTSCITMHWWTMHLYHHAPCTGERKFTLCQKLLE